MINEWAKKWDISQEALDDLIKRAQYVSESTSYTEKTPEAEVLATVRMEASTKGMRLWRNNVGAVYTNDGRFIRFGLANDSQAINSKVKSSDLIGIRKIKITPEMVGNHIGQFISREIKRPGWQYRNNEREEAQLAWITFINLMGGDAKFTTGYGSL